MPGSTKDLRYYEYKRIWKKTHLVHHESTVNYEAKTFNLVY